MNLRLEKDSIRVRVSFDEAVTLDREGHLQEELPLHGGALVLRVLCVTADSLSLEAGSRYSVDMRVPSARLRNMLTTSELALQETIKMGEHAVKVYFEIDRFTKRRQSHAQKVD